MADHSRRDEREKQAVKDGLYDRIHELFRYNKKTGEFIRRSTQGGRTAGSVAGYINKTDGYVRVRVDTQMWLAHRLAFLYVKGRFPRGELDHKDDVRSNNALKNLRECSISLNCANRRMSSLNTSGYRGVYKKKKGLWYAKCGKNTLGYFSSKKDAAKAYDKAARKLYGEFARLNFPNKEGQPGVVVCL